MKGNSSVRQQKSTEPLSLNGRKRAANVLGSFALAAFGVLSLRGIFTRSKAEQATDGGTANPSEGGDATA
ncbi:MAG: hypothetical protein VB062_01210 [Christensenella sp.]|nr:hypothetical protein [Christensenella sp.]